jgi:hypothetical protein
MPKKTYTQINSVTLATASSSVSFNSIPQTFRDLVVTYSFQGTGEITLFGTFNSDSGTNYPQQWMQNSGNSTRAQYFSNLTAIEAGYSSVASVMVNMQIQVFDYSTSDKHKMTLLRARSTNPDEVIFRGTRWANTNPITSINFTAVTSNITAGSTFTLYGIEA